MTTIKATVDSDTGTITVFNDGDGIPVVVHPTYNTYIPSLIFGQAARRIRGKSCACVIL